MRIADQMGRTRSNAIGHHDRCGTFAKVGLFPISRNGFYTTLACEVRSVQFINSFGYSENLFWHPVGIYSYANTPIISMPSFALRLPCWCPRHLYVAFRVYCCFSKHHDQRTLCRIKKRKPQNGGLLLVEQFDHILYFGICTRINLDPRMSRMAS